MSSLRSARSMAMVHASMVYCKTNSRGQLAPPDSAFCPTATSRYSRGTGTPKTLRAPQTLLLPSLLPCSTHKLAVKDAPKKVEERVASEACVTYTFAQVQQLCHPLLHHLSTCWVGGGGGVVVGWCGVVGWGGVAEGGGGGVGWGVGRGGGWTHQLAVKDAPKKVEQLVVWVVLLPHGACISQQGSLENECLHSFGFSRVNEADGALQAKQGAQQVLGV